MRYSRRWASVRTSTSPASRSTRRCLETAGWLNCRWCTRSPTGRSPCRSTSRMVRRLGSARTAKLTASNMPHRLYACQVIRWVGVPFFGDLPTDAVARVPKNEDGRRGRGPGREAAVRFRRGARLDASQVSDRRRAGGAPLAIGAGGGLIGLVFLLVQVLAGGGDGSGLALGGEEPASDLSAECQTGEDAAQNEDCRILAVVNSVQESWSGRLDGYQEVDTVFFSGGTNSGCGSATSSVGPFYCPVDRTVYIDLTFYDDLR